MNSRLSRRSMLALSAAAPLSLLRPRARAQLKEGVMAGKQGHTSEHPNAIRARRLYEAISARDTELLSTLLASDVVFHIPGTGMVAGEHKGKETIMRQWRSILEQTGGNFHMKLLSVLANDQYAVTKHRWIAERGGRRIEMDNFNVYRLDRMGKIIERWEFVEDQQAHDKFWS